MMPWYDKQLQEEERKMAKELNRQFAAAAAAVSGDVVKSLRITSHASIFTAELVALSLALDIVRRSRRQKFVIFSDSLSGLVAICNCQLETAYVQKFIINYCQLVNAGNSITLIWSYWYPR